MPDLWVIIILTLKKVYTRCMPDLWVIIILTFKTSGIFRGFPENLAQFPEFWGRGRGWEFGEFRLGIFGDKPRKSPNFGDGDGATPF